MIRHLLSSLLPEGDKAPLLGDLDEEFLELVSLRGHASARRWYLRQCLLSVPPLMMARWRRLCARDWQLSIAAVLCFVLAPILAIELLRSFVLGIGALGLLGLIAVTLAALWVMGRRADAGRLQASIDIDRAPADVWPWITEGDKEKAWVTWLTEVKNEGPSRQIWTLHNVNNGARCDTTYRYQQAFTQFLEPLITPQALKKFNGDLLRLKSAAEASPLATR